MSVGTGKHNWVAIRRDYVEGYQINGSGDVHYPTQEDVAEKHHVAAQYVEQRCAKEGWTELRQEFVRKLDAARKVKRIDKLGTAGAQFDSRCLAASNQLMEGCGKVYASLFVDRIPEPLEVQRISTAYRIAQLIGKIALGETSGGDELTVPLLPDGGSVVRITYARRVADEIDGQ